MDKVLNQLSGDTAPALICLRGYSGGNTDYKAAKKPRGGDKWKYIPETDLLKMRQTKEWAGLVMPEGRITCDIDDTQYFDCIHRGLKRLGIRHIAIRTPNGGQIIFKDRKIIKSQSAKMLTIGGFICDYRLSGKGYIVLPMPHTEGRKVIHADEQLDSMPLIFLPVRRYNKEKDEEKILPSVILEGARDDTLFRHAARIKEWDFKYQLGIGDRNRLDILHSINQIFCSPPLSNKEVEQKSRSAEKNPPISKQLPEVPKIRTVSIAEMLTVEFTPREPILVPWLPTQGLAMIHSYRGTGKTHLALGIAIAVVSAGKFLRWEAPKPRGVLYIDGEMPGAVLQERLARIIDSAEKEPIAPLKIVTPDLQDFCLPDLSTFEGQSAYDELLEGVSLVIVDNLSTLCRSGEESKGESWLPVQGWALALRRRGISVLLIHHSGKGGSQRGTSRREDVLDSVIHLRRSGDYRPEDGASFEIHFEKARGIYGDDVKTFEAKLTTGPDGKQLWETKDVEQSLTEKVSDLLNEGIPQHEIPELLGVAKGTVSKHKNKAHVLGLLRAR
jgi:hypothetical protein